MQKKTIVMLFRIDAEMKHRTWFFCHAERNLIKYSVGVIPTSAIAGPFQDNKRLVAEPNSVPFEESGFECTQVMLSFSITQ